MAHLSFLYISDKGLDKIVLRIKNVKALTILEKRKQQNKTQ